MGAWGTGIPSDDTVRDVYDSYIDLFNRRNSVLGQTSLKLTRVA
jgi:hypothetical protein